MGVDRRMSLRVCAWGVSVVLAMGGAGCADGGPDGTGEPDGTGAQDPIGMLDRVGGKDRIGGQDGTGDGSKTGSTAPNFQAPFPCGQSWTYSHHSAEVRRALDFIDNGGATNGSPVLASAAGTAIRGDQPGGAGQYIVIEHGGGWRTYYFHLQAYSVPSGAVVQQGETVGLVGSTGASSGPHLHYEQLLDLVGQDIVINGVGLSPYPGSYRQKSITSANCGGGTSACEVRGDGKLYCANTPDAAMYAQPTASSAVVNHLRTTYSYFECWGTGDLHARGNTTWYKTIGDDNASRGWLPAVALSTTSLFDADPSAHGLARCP